MSSIRQNKIEATIQEELSIVFQRNASEMCLGAMVSVTAVRITSDLSIARCYLSIFGAPEKKDVLEEIQMHSSRIRGEVGKRLKNMRILVTFCVFCSFSFLAAKIIVYFL